MSGARILLVVLGATALLAVLALRDDEARQIARGVEETEAAFAVVEQQLREAGPAWEFLTGQGPALGLRDEHELVVTRLAELRGRRVDLEQAEGLAPVERLAAMRALVTEIDTLAALARQHGARVVARHDFIVESSPLFGEARALQQRLAGIAPPDEATTTRIAQLASSFADLEQRAKLAVRVMLENAEQGRLLGAAVVSGLHTQIEQQRLALAAAAPDAGGDPRPDGG